MSTPTVKIPPAIQRFFAGGAPPPEFLAALRAGQLELSDQTIISLSRLECTGSQMRVTARLLLGWIGMLDIDAITEPDRPATVARVHRRLQSHYGQLTSADTRSVETYILFARRVLEATDAQLDDLVIAARKGWGAFRRAITPPSDRGTRAPKARTVPPVKTALASFLAACEVTVATDRGAAKAKLLAAREAIDAALAALDQEPDPVVEPAPVVEEAVEDGLDAFFAELAPAEVEGTSGAPVAVVEAVQERIWPLRDDLRLRCWVQELDADDTGDVSFDLRGQIEELVDGAWDAPEAEGVGDWCIEEYVTRAEVAAHLARLTDWTAVIKAPPIARSLLVAAREQARKEREEEDYRLFLIWRKLPDKERGSYPWPSEPGWNSADACRLDSCCNRFQAEHAAEIAAFSARLDAQHRREEGCWEAGGDCDDY